MSGNVWELCWDWHGTVAAGTAIDPAGRPLGTYRAVRGSGWNGDASRCAVADRGGNYPDIRYNYVGFRVASENVLKNHGLSHFCVSML
jgi:formylglycine-generating enzyme required for sulfatase activity